MIFPTYALARTVVSKQWALFAAVGAAAAPALSYAPFLVEEPLAYPYATVALWLIARHARRPEARHGPGRRRDLPRRAARPRRSSRCSCPRSLSRSRRWPGRANVCGRRRAAGPPGTGRRWSRSGSGSRSRSARSSGTSPSRGTSRRGSTRAGCSSTDSGRSARSGSGSGCCRSSPASRRCRDAASRDNPKVRAFVITSASAIACFGFYTAVKAAYISTVFATRVEERNVIYLVPLLFVGTAIAARAAARRPRWPWRAQRSCALYLVITTPSELDAFPYCDAPALVDRSRSETASSPGTRSRSSARSSSHS